MAHISPPLCYPSPYSLFAHMSSPSPLVISLVLFSPPLYLFYILAYIPRLLSPYTLLHLSPIYLTSPPVSSVLFYVSQIAQMVILPPHSFILLLFSFWSSCFFFTRPLPSFFGGLVPGFLVLFCSYTHSLSLQ